MRKLFSLLLLVTVLSLVVSACGGGDSSSPTKAPATTPPNATARPTTPPTATAVPVPTGTVRLAVDQFPGYGLLPGIGGNRRHLDQMFDPLIGSNVQGQMDGKYGFVTSWTSSPDLTKWTFKTRDGVTFHNGDKASAADLKFSLEWYQTPDMTNPTASGSVTRLQTLASVDLVDPSTATANLKARDFFFPQRFLTLNGLGSGSGYLVPKVYMEAKGKDAVKAPVGSGPYKFRNAIDNQEVVADAGDAPHWLLGIPKFRTATVLAIPESTTRVALLKSGGAEAAVVLFPDLKDVKAQGFDVQASLESRTGYLGIYDQFVKEYSGQPNPLADVRVRKALSLAVDREGLVNGFLAGNGRPIDSHIMGKVNPAYKDYPAGKQDLAGAKKMLADAGYPNGFRVQSYSLTNQGLVISAEMMEAIAVWWESIGIKVDRKPMDVFAFLALIPKHDFGMPTVGGLWYSAYTSFLAGSAVGWKGQINRTTEDDELDQLYKDLGNVTNQADYIRLAQAYTDAERAKRITIPLWNSGDAYAVKPGLGGKEWHLGNSLWSCNFVGLLTGKQATGR